MFPLNRQIPANLYHLVDSKSKKDLVKNKREFPCELYGFVGYYGMHIYDVVHGLWLVVDDAKGEDFTGYVE